MKTLQRLLLFILLAACIFVLVGFLLPRKIHVERGLVIDASAKSIYNQLNTVKNWDKWSPWIKTDKNIQLKISGPEYGVGSRIEWLSKNKNVGSGSMLIIGSAPNDSISFILDYGKRGKSTGCLRFVNEKQGTKVIWSIGSNLGLNPVSRWIGLLSDKMIGPDLKKGLTNIDALMAERQFPNKYEVVEVEVPGRVLITIRDTASPASLNQKMTFMFEKISKFLKKRDLSPTGPPLTIFHTVTPAYFDIETCLPINTIVQVPKGLKCTQESAQKTIMVKHFGSYKLIANAYEELQTYLLNKKMAISGPEWEEYTTNPYLEADSSKWQTNIYFPVY